MDLYPPLPRTVRERALGTRQAGDERRGEAADKREQRVLGPADDAGVVYEEDPHRVRSATTRSVRSSTSSAIRSQLSRAARARAASPSRTRSSRSSSSSVIASATAT